MCGDFKELERALAHTERLWREERRGRREAEACRDALLAYFFSEYLDNPEAKFRQVTREETH